MNFKYFITIFFAGLIFTTGWSQAPKDITSGSIYEMIQKLGVLGTVVYVAAHPDDENTTLISYLANERKYDVIYLSMTRGDGGQNLIGPEIREHLGLIRTQELLAARRIDGGNQWFTRANDFGYSKNPQETFNIWDKEEILKDVVWALRLWKPDVIVNRFDHRPGRPNHGHHTASAMLSHEAFDLIGDPKVYPDQLDYVDTWEAQRLFLNTSWWFYGSREAFNQADKTYMDSVEVGVYFPLKGLSNTEISAMSRSMHKCQGFGRLRDRGSQMEYLELLKGEKGSGDFMADINTTWSRVPNGESIGKLVKALELSFDHSHPEKSIPRLIEVKKAIESLPPSYWTIRKLKEVNTIMEHLLGLYVEVYSGDQFVLGGEKTNLHIEVTQRNPGTLMLKSISSTGLNLDTIFNKKLQNNIPFTFTPMVQIDPDLPESNPYWLNEEPLLGRFVVSEQTLIGKPESDHPLKVYFHFEINSTNFDLVKEVIHKRRDPVKAEIYEPLPVVSPVYVNMTEEVSIFNGGQPQQVSVTVRASQENVSGELILEVPDNWSITPKLHPINLEKAGEQQIYFFTVTPPQNTSEIEVHPHIKIGDQTYTRSWRQIAYDHIPTQTVMQTAKAKWVNIDLAIAGQKIGYIMGAGDDVPKHLSQVGYEVTMLQEADWNLASLQQYDAIILGIRAYNTLDRLDFYMDDLFDYCKNGGTVIVQYNTSRGLKVQEIAPYDLQLSRDRVTVEEAPIKILEKDHPVLNYPNAITQADFDGWVQERGLYFPDQWDAAFTPILESNDPGEAPTKGALLVADYGNGHFVYTGLSWFRELPAGVPGAYRLLANLIALGNKPRP